MKGTVKEKNWKAIKQGLDTIIRSDLYAQDRSDWLRCPFLLGTRTFDLTSSDTYFVIWFYTWLGNNGSSINDVTPEGQRGGYKNWNFGVIFKT